MDWNIESLARLSGLPFALGVKPYATLLVFGLLLRLGYIGDPFFLQVQFRIFGDNWFLLAVLILFALETLADKIPLVDHIWDILHAFIKPLAGALMTFLALNALHTEQALGLIVLVSAVIGGSAISFSVHATKSVLRLASTVTTVGAGNPFISLVEDIFAAVFTVLVVRHPYVAGAVILVFLIGFTLITVLAFRKVAAFVRRAGVLVVSRLRARRLVPP